jgi:anti-anti-sigma factor
MPDHASRSGPAPRKVSCFVALSIRGGTLVARLTGPTVAEREAMIIAQSITGAIEAHRRRLRRFVLDLSDVRIMTSMGLGMCIDVRNRAVEQGAEAIMFGVRPQLGELMRMMRVDRLYMIIQDEAELSRMLAASR